MILRKGVKYNMGDRAVISNKNKNLGVYLHWYGYREAVESILAYCEAKKYRSPDVDDEYGWARLCQVAGNTIGGTLSVGVGIFDKMDTDNWDNGTYIIQGWDIVERLYQQYPDEKLKDTMYENLRMINSKQPKEEQLEDKELQAFAKLWEVRNLDRLSDERRAEVEQRIKEEKRQSIERDLEQFDKDEKKVKEMSELIKKDKGVLKFINDIDKDVQKPVENNIKEDNGVNDKEEKGDDNIERD